MRTKKKTTDKRDTIWCILMIVSCLFPFAIPLTFFALYQESKDFNIHNHRLLYCGLGACSFSFFMLSGTTIPILITGEFSDIIPVFFIYYGVSLLFGIFLLIAYGILMRRNRCVHKCLMLICNEHITSVGRIAEILGISPEKAGILLKKVIDAGLLEGASLPENSDELVFTKSIWAHQHVVCENCGAELFVNLGQTLTCAYCGGALKARRIRDASFS